MKLMNFVVILPVSLILISSASASEECGSYSGVQLYCPSGYHCCSKTESTCCSNGYVCAGNSLCISLAVIIVPVVIAFIVVVVIIICYAQKKKNQPGMVIHPQQTTTAETTVQNQQTQPEKQTQQ